MPCDTTTLVFSRQSRLALSCALLVALLCLRSSMHADAPPTDGMLIDHAWSGHRLSFDLLTERGHQFVAYYDSERRLTVAGRRLGEDAWVRVHPEGVPVPDRGRMSNVTGWDSHNSLVMALDRDGCLHVSGNMHVDPLVYYRTRKPFDLATLERVDRMTGEREDRVTYPAFSITAAGDLLFKYRDGSSGNGSDLYNLYDPAARSWTRFFDGPLLDGEGERSAYGTGPRRGPDGRYHMVWMWRDTPDAMTNHTLSYARSVDLKDWESTEGRPMPRPITMAGAEVIDPAKPGGGLINMTYALGWDAQKQPVVVYHRFDDRGRSQVFAARPQGGGGWRSRALSCWDFRWDFSGPGSQERQVSVAPPMPDKDGSLLIGYSTPATGSRRWRIDADTLEVLEELPTSSRHTPEAFLKPRGACPGLEVRTEEDLHDGRRWVLRWETLGANRELKDRPAPPPSELRLHELPAGDSSSP